MRGDRGLSEQDFFKLLEKLEGDADKSQQAQELLDNVTSGGDLPDQGEILKMIQDLTADLSEEKRCQLKEFIAEAAQQLDGEQLAGDLLKMLALFLDRT